MSPSPSTDLNATPKTPTRSERSREALSSPTSAPQNSQKMTTPASRKPPKLGLPKSASKKVSSGPVGPASPSAVGQSAPKKGENNTKDNSSQPRRKIELKDNDEHRRSEADNNDENPSAADTTGLKEEAPYPMQEQSEGDLGVVNGRTSESGGEKLGDESSKEGAEQVSEPEDDSEVRNSPQNTSTATDSNDNEHPKQKDTTSQNSNITQSAVKDRQNRETGLKEGSASNNGDKVQENLGSTRRAATNADSGVDNAEEGASKDVAMSTNDVKEPSKGLEGTADNDMKNRNENPATNVEIGAEKVAEDAKGTAHDAAMDAEDKVDSGTEDITESVKDGDTSNTDDIKSLKGLKVQNNGEILDNTGNVIGKLEEGDPTDLEGYEVGNNGEIMDEDGDVVGRASLFNNDRKETAKDAVTAIDDKAGDVVETDLPNLDVLKGLEVQKNGDIIDNNGVVIGRITEGDPADLVGMTLNEDGEVLDEDHDVVGRAETIRQQVKKEPQDHNPGLDILDGLEVNEDGTIKDTKGNVLAKITEGDPKDLTGRKVNADGEVLDDDGDVIGRAEIASDAIRFAKDQASENTTDTTEAPGIEALEKQLIPNLDIVEGRKLNKKGNILDDEGEVLAHLVEGDVKACAGKKPNQKGEILDDNGDFLGKVEIVPGEAANQAMENAYPEVAKQLEEAKKAPTEPRATEVEGTSNAFGVEQESDKASSELLQLQGLTVDKKGEVVNQEGDPIARLVEGELDEAYRHKVNEKGEITDNEGNVLGRVELIKEADDQKDRRTDEDPDMLDTSFLEGYRINKSGNVLNEDGDVIARLSYGNIDDVVGKRLNRKGEIQDNDENVIGKVDIVRKEDEEIEAQADENLPPLSTLQGLKVNKSGKMVDDKGNVVGELIEGDAKKLWKLAMTADDEGKFWDKGRVIGRANPVAIEEENEGAFSGLEGLVVVKNGWVEDENGNKVGKIVEGDAKTLVGRAVDEDGDILDKKGNAVGHAERYDEPEEEEPAPADLSELRGLICNKQGNVIGPDGVPIGRLVQGNPKELAGRKIDENGQIWNDAGKVVGTCEIIPPEEREAKAEGPFAGLDGLVVVENGFVQDSEGNNVGKLIEGDPKKLAGRAVDEDGEIIDKYGNVKGRAVPYEEPEQEAEDLSSLAGKSVNKRGKVVDEHGTIFGEVVEGNSERLAGCKVDGQGQIWSNDGKVIGRARVISGGDDGRAEGPFSNFESTRVSKDGTIKDHDGEVVGRVVEGDPKQLAGRRVDDSGDIVDKNGNIIGKAERWEPEEKPREVNAMAGLRVNKEGEVRDKNGDVVGKLTDGNLLHCIGREINDNGYVVDQDGNKLGEVTLIENIQEEEEPEQGMTDEETKATEEREIAKKIANIIFQTIDKMEPICKQIEEAVEKADRTPREELDEEALVSQIKPLIEEGGRILSECNGSIRGLDPDGHIAAQAKSRHASGEASPEENRVAEGLKELTGNIVKCIDNAKKKIADMPHAKKKLSPLWALLTEPLFQIIAAVGLLLSGVLGLVGKLLNGLGLGGLVNGLLGGLGINKLLDGIGLGSISESLGLGGGKKK